MPSHDGLSSQDAEKLLAKYGPNKLPEKKPQSSLSIFVSQLKSPLVYILVFAGLITIFLEDFADALVIFAAVSINTILGFVQEKRASDALDALKKMIHPEAKVVRNGEQLSIPVEEVVPGDIVVLNQGYKVPADGELVKANRLFLEEAMLTGESVPVPKKNGDKAFMGTVVTNGRGYMKVSTTGEETEIGKIAETVQTVEEETPMKKQLRNFSKQLTFLVVGLTVIVFFIGLLNGRGLVEVFTTSVALAVSAIPEGLLVGLTVVLAIGMQRILRKKGLVKNLVSAETLGGVTTICTDKTGTLTEGKMIVVHHLGDIEDLSEQAVLANDLDDPVVLAAHDWGSKKIKTEVHELIDLHPRIDSIPFSSAERFFASLHQWDAKSNILFVNGAPEYLLEWTNLSIKQKTEIKKQIEEMTSKGMRLVGMARKKIHKERKSISKQMVKSELEWIGILGLSDPIRKGIKEALKKTNKAGIKVLVITGDYAQTAQSVMREAGLLVKDDEIVTGDDLAKMSSSQLSAKLRMNQVSLFARTTPDQKLKIVEALKANGEVIAMMGDGVNDAPALSKADIGIVVGEATDVAKESADLVLLDSSFSTITQAIEEGRGIFDNLRKIILYLMSDAFSEIVAVLMSILLGFPLAVTAAQILWINLVSDGLPHLALAVDPKRKNIMSSNPRSPKEPLVNLNMKLLIGFVSVIGGLLAFALFYFVYQIEGLELARSVAFAVLGTNSLIYVFSIKTLKDPVWRQNPFDNLWLIGAVVVGFVAQVLPFIYLPLGKFLDAVPIPLTYWFYIIAVSVVVFLCIEMSKFVFRNNKRW